MFEFIKRDFMLGVGAGLIISGIMVSWSGSGQLTDAEIMERAAKLGMIQKQEAGQAQKSEPIKAPSQQPETGDTSPAQKPEAVTIQIKSGMGSETVARLLEEKGAITDREEFYKVLTKYKAHSKLKVGTFKIPAGAEMKEIVDILTGKSKDN